MINLQKAKDTAVQMGMYYKDYHAEVGLTINKAISEGHNGCICYQMPCTTQAFLEKQGFLVEEETEDDNHYWIVSWQEQIII